MGLGHITRFQALVSPTVLDVLRRYPAAPPGGARTGELIRLLDAALR